MAEIRRLVKTEMELQVTCKGEPGQLSEVLKILRESGGDLKAHLIFRPAEQGKRVALFVCEHPTEAAVALRESGFAVETGTVVTVEAEDQVGALSHLVRTLEVEGLSLGYSYCTSYSDLLCCVLRTDDNPRAEDVLRAYLQLPDPQEPNP